MVSIWWCANATGPCDSSGAGNGNPRKEDDTADFEEVEEEEVEEEEWSEEGYGLAGAWKKEPEKRRKLNQRHILSPRHNTVHNRVSVHVKGPTSVRGCAYTWLWHVLASQIRPPTGENPETLLSPCSQLFSPRSILINRREMNPFFDDWPVGLRAFWPRNCWAKRLFRRLAASLRPKNYFLIKDTVERIKKQTNKKLTRPNACVFEFEERLVLL